jgi:hypothetical protein
MLYVPEQARRPSSNVDLQMSIAAHRNTHDNRCIGDSAHESCPATDCMAAGTMRRSPLRYVANRLSHVREYMAVRDQPMRHLPLSHAFASWMHSKVRLGSCNFGMINAFKRRSRLCCGVRLVKNPRFVNSASHLKPLLFLLRPRTNLS